MIEFYLIISLPPALAPAFRPRACAPQDLSIEQHADLSSAIELVTAAAR